MNANQHLIIENQYFSNSPNATLRSAFSWKNFEKKIGKFSVKYFFNFFLAIVVLQPILGMPAKTLGGLGPLVWEEIENGQTVHKPKLKFIYRCGVLES
jgi:hypothetical protein